MADDQIIKLCECGCGQAAPLACRSRKGKGWVKGQPTRFIHNHHRVTARQDLLARVMARCVWDGQCCIWQGAKSKAGYGQIVVGRKVVYVHRAVYEYHHGPIPAGLELDHVADRGCCSRACCNEAHLEAVLPRENILRGSSPPAQNARRTHCPHGHPYSGDNVSVNSQGHRDCRACTTAQRRLSRARKKLSHRVP